MRADMAKVIVERPRHKGRAWKKPKGNQRRLGRYGDDAPKREGIKTCWGGNTKSFNEHLGPLRRYLDKQVGRPWDKVFAEICAHINRDSAVQDHVRDHVQQYVVTQVVVIDGVSCDGRGHRLYGTPLDSTYGGRWYVCPRTGLLRRIKRRSRKRRPEPEQTERPFVRVSELEQCRYLDGAWHLVTLQRLPTTPRQIARCAAVDILLNRRVAFLPLEDARKFYGAAVYAVARRPLARRELGQYPIPVHLWR